MKIKFSLRKKILIILLSIMTSIVILFGTYIIINYKNSRLSSFVERCNNLSIITLSNIVPGVEFGQKDFIEKIFFNLESDNNFLSGIIYDTQGKIFVNYSVKERNSSKQDFNKNSENTISFRLKINSEVQGELGFLVLLFSKTRLLTDINIVLKYFILLFSFLIIIMVLSVFLIIEKIILKPIRKLHDGTENVSKGELQTSVIVNTSDELGVLANNFNLMTKNLYNSFSKLETNKNAIEKLQQYLESIIENSPNNIITIDNKFNIVKINKTAIEEFNLSNAEYFGNSIFNYFPFFKKYEFKLNKLLSNTKPIKINMETVDINGKEKLIDIVMYQIETEEKKGIVIIIIDKTDIALLENQLIQSQKMDAIGTLAGGLAHDFNNVLGMIIGTLSLIEQKKKRGQLSEDKIEKYLSYISESAYRASDIVKNLLTLSRKEELQIKSADLIVLVKRVVKLIKNTFDKSIKINLKISILKSSIKVDVTQIEQAILNICVNAAHSMTIMRDNSKKWGGKLSIEIDRFFADDLFISKNIITESGFYYSITIRDEGIGINNKSISKIFAPFYTTKEKNDGTGLGLAMVYNIVRKHEGFVDVYSELGKGSNFVIYLPERKSPIDRVEDPKEKKKTPQGEGTILVVEDEKVLQVVAKAILKSSGYSVIEASDGDEAISLYKKYHKKIDLVLLDMQLPKKSGKEVYYELKKINNNVKVLLTSGFKRDERIEELLSKEVKYFIEKPYNFDTLAIKVHEILKH